MRKYGKLPPFFHYLFHIYHVIGRATGSFSDFFLGGLLRASLGEFVIKEKVVPDVD